jgi:hypothetical protein
MSLKVKIEQRCASSLSCSQKADSIINLLPCKRYPAVDGWPLDPNENIIGFNKNNCSAVYYAVDYERCGDPSPKDPIVWYVKMSEFLELMGEE